MHAATLVLMAHVGCAVDGAPIARDVGAEARNKQVLWGRMTLIKSPQGNGDDDFGWGASAGDVNGDGYGDVIFGAYSHNREGSDLTREGAAYVHFGSASGVSEAPAWRKIGTDHVGTHFGSNVGSAGDVDGDGYDDVFVSAIFETGPDGNVYLFHGSATGPAREASWEARPFRDVQEESDDFGTYVDSGDVNGDGFSDLIVGALEDEPIGSGSAAVYLGSSSGLPENAPPAWEVREWEHPNALFGHSVKLCDVTGDGYDDVIVSAPTLGPKQNGQIRMYIGSPGGPPPLPADPDWQILGGTHENLKGSIAADVNGDGYCDLLATADVEGLGTSRYDLRVFYGSASGLSDIADTSIQGGVLMDFGTASSAGDVNGDGFDDVITSHPFAPGVDGPGQIFLFLGSPSGLSPEPAAMASGTDDGDQFGNGADGVGDVDGDGFGDITFHRKYGVEAVAYGCAFDEDGVCLDDTLDPAF